MRYILFLTLPLLLCAKTTFITQEEYAAQLYKNPRGIGCQHCHGDKGEGKLVAKYKHKNVEKSFRGPMINNLDYAAFYKALNVRIDSMPRYFLTPKEISALYFFLNEDELRKAKEAKKAKEEQENKKIKDAKEATAIKKVQELKVSAEVKEENTTVKIQETQQAPEIKEMPQAPETQETKEMQLAPETTEIIDINEMFKEATEAKNAK